MTRYVNTLIFAICAFAAVAQVPQKFNYQAVARSIQGAVLPNQNMKIRASILDGSANSISQYSETHSATTNQLGLFNLAIGGGMVESGNFANITWASGDKYLKIEMDATGGNNFSLVGTSQLLSTPYAQFASVCGSSIGNTLWMVSVFGNNDIFHITGNVGIGVNNPQARLDILSNGDHWGNNGIAFSDNLANRYFMYKDLSNKFHIGYNGVKILSLNNGNLVPRPVNNAPFCGLIARSISLFVG